MNLIANSALGDASHHHNQSRHLRWKVRPLVDSNRLCLVSARQKIAFCCQAWRTHPLGQTLIVTSGCGWVQREGGEIEEIRPGDVVWCPPGEKHWHGAAPATAMTHIAIVEQLDGKTVDWMEKVSDEQYPASKSAER